MHRLGWGWGLVVVFCALRADARPTYPPQIPNAPGGCGTCHVSSAGGGARNPFGQDVERNLDGGRIDWASLAPLDSDGDGLTNGEELGDPDGSWRRGDPSPSGPVSAPGGGDGQGMDGAGGCTTAGPSAGPWLIILGVAAGLRRRRGTVV